MEEILAHTKRGKKFQLLTFIKGAPRHDATEQPTEDLVDADGTKMRCSWSIQPNIAS